MSAANSPATGSPKAAWKGKWGQAVRGESGLSAQSSAKAAQRIIAAQSASPGFPSEPAQGSRRPPGDAPCGCCLHSESRLLALERSLCQADNTGDECLVYLQGHQSCSSEPGELCCMCRPTVLWGESRGFLRFPRGPLSPKR